MFLSCSISCSGNMVIFSWLEFFTVNMRANVTALWLLGALWGLEVQDNLGLAPLKGLFMCGCALRCMERGEAVAFPHLLILMELWAHMLDLNILPQGRWKYKPSSFSSERKLMLKLLFGLLIESYKFDFLMQISF